MSVPGDAGAAADSWPAAPIEGWLETCTTLQLWTQIVGKVRLARAPFENHWWHVPLYVTARGLSTSVMPDGDRAFQIDLDFLSQQIAISTSDGRRSEMPLGPRPLADFMPSSWPGFPASESTSVSGRCRSK